MNQTRTAFHEWTSVWYGLGARPGSRVLFDSLCAAYNEPHRAYHTLEHIEQCLGLLDEVRSITEQPCEIAIALWFHDAVYDPRGRDNEARSAAWAAAALREHEVAKDAIGRVSQMILATSHGDARQRGDICVLVDIDLSILGAPPQAYDEYAAQIRREYAWVPPADYATARSKVLRSFLERASIYQTGTFRQRLEHAARSNIGRELDRLPRG